MATPSRVHLDTSEHPEFYLPNLTEDSAKKASECLQENHEQHHVLFNKFGYHNHIAHHLLTIYALAAPPDIIQRQYENNKSYQRPAVELEDSVEESMHDPEKFHSYLGNEKYYHDFLVFFQDEMEKKGWENVLNEYLFKGDERADDMLCRMFAGFLHPIIHLGFGIEFHQPAIIAEALAQAAVHGDWMKSFLLGAEKAAKANGDPSKTLVELLDAIRADEKLSGAAHWDDGNKVRDGVIARAADDMIKYASQYVVRPEDLEEKTAEMVNAAVYYTGAAQHPPKQVKYDFYYIHCVNCSIFFSAFLHASWLSTANKCRLLEWKARNDLAMYASRHSPELLLDEITNYKPKEEAGDEADPWKRIFERVCRHEDDGHASKLVRALAHGQKVCGEWEGKDSFRIKGDMWLKLGHMAIDSVEAGEPHWVRSCGFPQAWEEVPERSRL